ncbi:WPP domain-associated protein-like [Asparagus officinalis]|uniref:WPP domain-associated protein-like n=1 Tax=Asparagus officinalis TaxID=4686 RepID=UPI00098E8587|nr:WPP domain-associated protein-like [Asparagus officinalis]XP_020269133.1 WPP domain-associated protein-like [Asparagus officinalis]
MGSSEVLDKTHDLPNNTEVLSSSSYKESDAICNESVFYEKFLLDDLDNYWDELNDRLTVSRMVSDSVIKGMVNAVVEESEERIALKEAEISRLNKELQFHNNFDETVKWSLVADLGRLRLVAKEQIQKLKEDINSVIVSSSTGRVNSSTDLGLCNILPQTRSSEKMVETNERVDSLGMIVETLFKEVNEMFHLVKASMFEHQEEYEFEREISSILIKSSVSTIQDELEKKLHEQKGLINMLNKNRQQSVDELSSMREDLDTICRSLSSSDSGPLLSHNSLDSFDEWNTSKRKDHPSRRLSGNHHLPYAVQAEENGNTLMKPEDCEKPMMEVADPLQLKQMSKDELASYYKTEMIKMRRQHDSALQEKTEELFKLKREFLREKGSSLFKKDKEFELLKKKIPEVILKLDGILLEKEKLSIVQNDHDELCSLKGNIDTLLFENERLRGLLSEKGKEVKNLSSQVSDASNQMFLHSSAEAKLLQQINGLEGDLKDVQIEASIQDELHGIILKELVSENKCALEDAEIEARLVQDTYTTVVGGFIADGLSKINSFLSNHFAEKSSLEALVCEKERAISEEIEEEKKLKETIASLSTLMKEKEHDASTRFSTLMQQKQQFDLLNQEIDLLKEQIIKQEVLISDSKAEADSMKRRLEEALRQIHESEMEIKKLNENLLTTSTALEEAEKEKTVLHAIIEDRENKLLSSITKEKQQAKYMDSIVSSLMELSKASIDFENKMATDIERNEARLKILSRRWVPIMQQANMMSTKALLYKQMLEIKSSNLQKAEAEVDLLGDEVDALLSLLGKIYIALDHYSPVLQHYPGVMETLKLVQRELEGETTRSA